MVALVDQKESSKRFKNDTPEEAALIKMDGPQVSIISHDSNLRPGAHSHQNVNVLDQGQGSKDDHHVSRDDLAFADLEDSSLLSDQVEGSGLKLVSMIGCLWSHPIVLVVDYLRNWHLRRINGRL